MVDDDGTVGNASASAAGRGVMHHTNPHLASPCRPLPALAVFRSEDMFFLYLGVQVAVRGSRACTRTRRRRANGSGRCNWQTDDPDSRADGIWHRPSSQVQTPPVIPPAPAQSAETETGKLQMTCSHPSLISAPSAPTPPTTPPARPVVSMHGRGESHLHPRCRRHFPHPRLHSLR